MFNQEKLAAIAAALTYLQQSMQSNTQSDDGFPSATNTNHLVMAAQQQLVAAAVAAENQRQQLAALINHYQAQINQRNQLSQQADDLGQLLTSPPKLQPQQPQLSPTLSVSPETPLHQVQAIRSSQQYHPLLQLQQQQHQQHLQHQQQSIIQTDTREIMHQLQPQQPLLHMQQQQEMLPLQPQQQQHQRAERPLHQTHVPTSPTYLDKIRRPISYSAIVAKSAGQSPPPPHGRATNLLGFMGLYVGNLSSELTKEQLEKMFSKYGEPVRAHRLIRSPVAFIKYENTESPRAAIDDLYGVIDPELTLNQDQPLKLHFDRNDTQLKANYRPTELPKEDNGECFAWRTTVCRKGKNCTKKHIPINRGIDFQMWMIKSTPTS